MGNDRNMIHHCLPSTLTSSLCFKTSNDTKTRGSDPIIIWVKHVNIVWTLDRDSDRMFCNYLENRKLWQYYITTPSTLYSYYDSTRFCNIYSYVKTDKKLQIVTQLVPCVIGLVSGYNCTCYHLLTVADNSRMLLHNNYTPGRYYTTLSTTLLTMDTVDREINFFVLG